MYKVYVYRYEVGIFKQHHYDSSLRWHLFPTEKKPQVMKVCCCIHITKKILTKYNIQND